MKNIAITLGRIKVNSDNADNLSSAPYNLNSTGFRADLDLHDISSSWVIEIC